MIPQPRRSFILLLIAAALAMPPPGDSPRAAEAAQRQSGIEGEALIGPTRPLVRVGEQESGTPFETTLVILAAADRREVAKVKTGSDGRFRVVLPPGEYLVKPASEPRSRWPRAEEQRVKVGRRRFAHVTLHFDSGLR